MSTRTKIMETLRIKPRRRRGRDMQIKVVEGSPLRAADPRTKLILSLVASLTVMLPLEQLVYAIGAYLVLITWSRLLKPVAKQVWRIRIVLIGLFVVDWIFISLELATVVTLRLALLASTFAIFFSTTTPAEFRLALEWMRIPYRFAFSISMAFQSINILDREWKNIVEAQQSRGVWQAPKNVRQLFKQLGNLLALTVPAIVMTTKRAWAITESAYARGFDSPKRTAYRKLNMKKIDWILIALTISVSASFIVWNTVL